MNAVVSKENSYTAQDIATKLGGKLVSNKLSTKTKLIQESTASFSKLVPSSSPESGVVMVVPSAEKLAGLEAYDMLIVIAEDADLTDIALEDYLLLQVPNSRLALSQLSKLFNPRPQLPSGIHTTAIIEPSSQLGENVAVGINSVVAANAVIAEGTKIGTNCYIGENVQIGKNCQIEHNVTLYDGAILGDEVILHAGVVIGADSFGYAHDGNAYQKIEHLGGVVIESRVEMGANSSVDRSIFGTTKIGEGTKIGNLCQVAHHSTIGKHCLLTSLVGVAGSVTIGDNVDLGGHVGIGGHTTIGDGATVISGSGLSKSVPAGETWFGTPAMPIKKWTRQLYLRGNLEKIWNFVRAEEKKMKKSEDS